MINPLAAMILVFVLYVDTYSMHTYIIIIQFFKRFRGGGVKLLFFKLKNRFRLDVTLTEPCSGF